MSGVVTVCRSETPSGNEANEEDSQKKRCNDNAIEVAEGRQKKVKRDHTTESQEDSSGLFVD